MIQTMIRADVVDVNSRGSKDGWTPLIAVVYSGNRQAVENLFERSDLRPNETDNDGNRKINSKEFTINMYWFLFLF